MAVDGHKSTCTASISAVEPSRSLSFTQALLLRSQHVTNTYTDIHKHRHTQACTPRYKIKNKDQEPRLSIARDLWQQHECIAFSRVTTLAQKCLKGKTTSNSPRSREDERQGKHTVDSLQARFTHVASRQCSTTSTDPPKQPSRNAVEPSGAVRLVEALCCAWKWW